MFTALMFVCFVIMTGLFGQGRFFLGSLALAAAFGFGYLAEEFPRIEERIVGAFFAVGLVGMFVGMGIGLWHLFF